MAMILSIDRHIGMKRWFFLFLLLPLAVLSCKKEDPQPFSCSLFSAEIWPEYDSDTKTSFKNLDVLWSAGDAIRVNDGKFDLKSGAGTNFAQFSGNEVQAKGGFFYALYPYSAASGDRALTLPEEQVHNGLDSISCGFPMYAKSASKELHFCNSCGLLKLNLTFDNICTLSAVIVEADKPLCGPATIADDGTAVVDATKGRNSVRWTSTVPVSIKPSTACSLNIYLPAGEYSTFNMTFLYNSGNYTGLRCTRSLKSGKTIRIARGKVTTITLSGLKMWEWVDLDTKDNVKWGTTAVGVPLESGKYSVTQHGNYYAWGEKSNKTDYSAGTYAFGPSGAMTKYTASDGRTVLEPGDDVAFNERGGLWRMPSKAEIDALKSQCFWQWVSNYNSSGIAGCIVFRVKSEADRGIFRGDGIPSPSGSTYSYSDLHMFLPVSGLYTGTTKQSVDYAFFWSSTVSSGALLPYEFSYLVSVHNVGLDSDSIFRWSGLPVRAVFKD